MYAIIEDSGQQFKVSEGDVLRIDLMDAEGPGRDHRVRSRAAGGRRARTSRSARPWSEAPRSWRRWSKPRLPARRSSTSSTAGARAITVGRATARSTPRSASPASSPDPSPPGTRTNRSGGTQRMNAPRRFRPSRPRRFIIGALAVCLAAVAACQGLGPLAKGHGPLEPRSASERSRRRRSTSPPASSPAERRPGCSGR